MTEDYNPLLASVEGGLGRRDFLLFAVAAPLSLAAAKLAFAFPAFTEGEKPVVLPKEIYRVPKGNDFASDDSEFSNKRRVESANFALFWAKEYGSDPATDPPANKRFQTAELLRECERFYDAYVHKLKFVTAGHSVADKCKILIFVLGGSEGTAFGGAGDGVGMLWTPAVRINRPPYGAAAHEIGHTFQHFVQDDGAWGFSSHPKGSRGSPIHEMTSQYMLWQVYPEWMTFENYHLVNYLKQAHLAFLHEANQYTSPHVLEYWSGRHGVDFVGKIWRQAQRGEDPVMAYMRLNRLSQPKFNDEMFDAARRFITWDLKRIEKVAAKYANQHRTKMDSVGDGWFRVAASNCPQNYGYNGIRLKAPSEPAKVTLEFKGAIGAAGFRSIRPEAAGWRYGFLAVRADGSRVYGPVHSENEGKVQFDVPDKTEHLWLVVSGAPAEHWEHLADNDVSNDEQWPYQIRLTGTSLAVNEE